MIFYHHNNEDFKQQQFYLNSLEEESFCKKLKWKVV